MTIIESSQNGVKILKLSGRLDFAARREFQAAIEKVGQGGAGHLILNFQGVPFMDSAALGMLATMEKQLTAKNIQISITSPQEYVKKILLLAKMDSYFSIHATEDEARLSMAKA